MPLAPEGTLTDTGGNCFIQIRTNEDWQSRVIWVYKNIEIQEFSGYQPGLGPYLKAQPEKDPLPISHGYWQNSTALRSSVPCWLLVRVCFQLLAMWTSPTRQLALWKLARKPSSKTEVTLFYTFITAETPITFSIFCWLEASYRSCAHSRVGIIPEGEN